MPRPNRLESLDAFRGLTIAAMILVNNPGDWGVVFPQLSHAYWTGVTFADLVFPWFIFIMGFAMPFAFARRQARGARADDLHRRIASRVAWLLALGLVLNAVAAWPAIAPLRLPGVLQRIALAYLIAALTVVHLDVRGWMATAVVLLIGHWMLLMLVPFGGFPAGTLTPEHNLARHVDLVVFGDHATTRTLDPEGLLGVLTSAATALIGACSAELVRRLPTHRSRLAMLVAAGGALIVLGLTWSPLLPLSKPLWTGSYVLVVSGTAMLAIAVTSGLIDVLGATGWARPFIWLGVNPLAVYFLSDVAGHLLEHSWVRLGTGRTTPKGWLMWGWIEPALRPLRPEWASLAFALLFLTIWIGVAGVLHRRHIRIRV